jgi:hypothetical protein
LTAFVRYEAPELVRTNVVIGSIQVSSAERSPRDLSTFFRLYEYPRYCKVVSRNERLALDGSANLGMYFRSGGQRLLKIHDWPVVSEELGADVYYPVGEVQVLKVQLFSILRANHIYISGLVVVFTNKLVISNFQMVQYEYLFLCSPDGDTYLNF